MSDLVLTCEICGHRMRIPEYAMGSKGKCAQCGAVLLVGPDNTAPLTPEKPLPVPSPTGWESATPPGWESDEPEQAPPPTPSQPTPAESKSTPPGFDLERYIEPEAPRIVRPKGDQCVRCGKAFRGEWDRNVTGDGAICHICARLAAEGSSPQVEASTFHETPPPPEAYFPREPVGEEKKTDGPKFAQKHPELFRRAILAAGIGVIVLGLLFALFGDLDIPDEYQTTAAEIAQADAEGGLPGIVALGLWLALLPVSHLLAIYMALAWADKLPAANLPMNLLVLIPAAAVMAFFNVIPCFGVIMSAYILYQWYDLNFQQIFVFFVLLIPAGLLSWIVTQFVCGVIGQIVYG